MKLSDFIAGLAILREHFTEKDGYHIDAEHDQFYVYPTDTPLSEAEVALMRSHDWFQPEQDIPDGEEHGPYDPGEPWSAFT